MEALLKFGVDNVYAFSTALVVSLIAAFIIGANRINADDKLFYLDLGITLDGDLNITTAEGSTLIFNTGEVSKGYGSITLTEGQKEFITNSLFFENGKWSVPEDEPDNPLDMDRDLVLIQWNVMENIHAFDEDRIRAKFTFQSPSGALSTYTIVNG